MNNRHFKINEANILFLILAFVFLTLGAYMQSLDLIKGLLFTEYGILVVPIIVYALVTKKDIKQVFRVKKLPIKVAFQIIFMSILLVPAIALVNLIALFVIELFSTSITMPIPTATTGGELLMYFFVIAITAGICEELFFRGMILNAYENEVDMKTAVIFSALLFGIFHFNPQNLLGPILLGLVYGYLVQLTGSIYAGIIAHATNNGVAVVMGYLVSFGNTTGNTDYLEAVGGDPFAGSMAILAGVILFYAVLSIASLVGVKVMLSRIQRSYPRYDIGDNLIVKAKMYEITNIEDETLEIKSVLGKTNGETMYTDIERLRQVKAISKYRLWKGERIKIKFAKLLPIFVTLVFYGFIIYSAYFGVS